MLKAKWSGGDRCEQEAGGSVESLPLPSDFTGSQGPHGDELTHSLTLAIKSLGCPGRTC